MKTETSRETFNRAEKLLCGGVNSPVRAIKPYPFYTKEAKGSRITDIDGNEFMDYCMAYGPKLFGHAHPEIREAARTQLESGWLYGTPTENEVTVAETITQLYPSIDMIRFVSTGTEATMGAIRIARGYTEKNKIIKIEGGFHGAHDAVLIKAGSGATTHGVPDSPGIPADVTKNTLQIPYNNTDALTTTIEKNRNEIAALIMEPVLGNIGPILPEKDYLREARKITEENDVLLIFDEVITGFRISPGGAQEYYNITPDITTLGKVLGGGFPIGAIGGKREIMKIVSPAGPVYQAGTFNANPISLAAAKTVLKLIQKEPSLYKKLNSEGERLRTSLTGIIEDKKLPYSVSGIASLFKVFFGKKPKNYTDALQCNKDAYHRFFHRMLKSGIFLPPSQFETNFLSTAHSTEDIDETIEAYRRNLKE
ncbi:glutamate-1-semialdehyde-2,1-aminomutase [Methanosarcinales archaeon ex4484_138]|nr:MAG: glutamate-1-semialdehyde-2,1-aminomutase [Methanosarcinales archaeon ex4484_138]RLG26579.1 MAG: glutamate-1-semialdehyde-2,1-aminomutase [Methanosarcinales archaeon]